VVKIKNKDKYESTDFNLVVALACSGHIVLDVIGGKQKKFYLKDTDKLQDDVKMYYRREMLVDPVSFYNEAKLLKNRIYENN